MGLSSEEVPSENFQSPDQRLKGPTSRMVWGFLRRRRRAPSVAADISGNYRRHNKNIIHFEGKQAKLGIIFLKFCCLFVCNGENLEVKANRVLHFQYVVTFIFRRTEEEDGRVEEAEEAEEVISYHMGLWILHIRDTFAD